MGVPASFSSAGAGVSLPAHHGRPTDGALAQASAAIRRFPDAPEGRRPRVSADSDMSRVVTPGREERRFEDGPHGSRPRGIPRVSRTSWLEPLSRENGAVMAVDGSVGVLPGSRTRTSRRALRVRPGHRCGSLRAVMSLPGCGLANATSSRTSTGSRPQGPNVVSPPATHPNKPAPTSLSTRPRIPARGYSGDVRCSSRSRPSSGSSVVRYSVTSSRRTWRVDLVSP